MAIWANMSGSGDDSKDGHEHDLVMPGFRFHPTEEELIEFYLRRKVEGKRFNIELITFLDLYRYDPWELAALAAIGEKEWFFYVPRDRKYRNGDRPNRVTTSGYWKATGADRMIRAENSRSIGLKKTLVFYSGKAPKGVRTSWIMNEYRLPQSETERCRKAEISLCRVYKRANVEDHCHLPTTLSSKPSSSKATSSNKDHNQADHRPSFGSLGVNSSSLEMDRIHEANMPMPAQQPPMVAFGATAPTTASTAPLGSSTSLEETAPVMHRSKTSTVDELDRMVGFNQSYYLNQTEQMLPLAPQLLPLNALPNLSPPTISDKLWEWNSLPESERDYTNNFQ